MSVKVMPTERVCFSLPEIVTVSVSKLYSKDLTVKSSLEDHCRKKELADGHCPQDFIFKSTDYNRLDERGLKAKPVLPAKQRILLQQ